MNLFLIKIGFALAVFLLGWIGALLSFLPHRGPTSTKIMALGDTFAGGILGGAGLIHLLSGGMEAFRRVAPALQYPFALLLAGAGFLLILLIEGVIVTGSSTAVLHGSYHSIGTQHEVVEPEQEHIIHRPYAFLLLLVLSVHSLIAGAALGAQGAVRTALVVFLAIVAHKAVAGFALGVGYRRTELPLRRIVPRIAFFAAMTPLGILAGTFTQLVISTHGDILFEAVFDSLGAGTFLYIAALDIIRTEFDEPGAHWQKWMSACLGFTIMALLAVWI
jgi:zinc transporter 1/2/3